MRLVAAVTESPRVILPADRQQIGRIPTAPVIDKSTLGGNSFDDVLGGQHRRHSARVGLDSVSPDIRMKKRR
jgi:hypothetical protein